MAAVSDNIKESCRKQSEKENGGKIDSVSPTLRKILAFILIDVNY